MANQKHLALLREDVAFVWDIWRQEHPDEQPDLSGVDLSMSNLWASGLYKKEIQEAYYEEDGRGDIQAIYGIRGLTEASIVVDSLRNSNMSGVNFSGANLSRLDLKGANLKGVRLRGTDLSGANLSKADLKGADLSGAVCVETNFIEAMLTDCRIYGISVWNVQLEGAMQNNLVITPEKEPTITVDNLEVAQFIYLLLNNPKIRDVINTIGQKGVLILGRFTPERKAVLDALREKLRSLNFVPIVFDFERPTTHDFTETIMTLAGLSCFIIADITNPKSSPLELQATVPNYMTPFVPIIQEGEQPFAIFTDL